MAARVPVKARTPEPGSCDTARVIPFPSTFASPWTATVQPLCAGAVSFGGRPGSGVAPEKDSWYSLRQLGFLARMTALATAVGDSPAASRAAYCGAWGISTV